MQHKTSSFNLTVLYEPFLDTVMKSHVTATFPNRIHLSSQLHVFD